MSRATAVLLVSFGLAISLAETSHAQGHHAPAATHAPPAPRAPAAPMAEPAPSSSLPPLVGGFLPGGAFGPTSVGSNGLISPAPFGVFGGGFFMTPAFVVGPVNSFPTGPAFYPGMPLPDTRMPPPDLFLEDFGPAGPQGPPTAFVPPRRGPARNVRTDPAKAAQMVKIGDRQFRLGNMTRATDRYVLASRADPGSATPQVRLAQVALTRGRYAEAANRLREAEAIEPGWIARAKDVESLYAEPEDFAKQIAKLESHLQTHPEDRDAWLVLGANWFLSGKGRQAADVFLRLSDRKADAVLSAFLAASDPRNLDAAKK